MEHLCRWKDTLLIPSFAAVASGILLIAHFISCSFDSPQRDATEEVLLAVNEETRSNWFGRKIIQHVHSNGGPVIFGFKIARLTGCLTLFSLSLATLLLRSVDTTYHELMRDWDKKDSLDNLPQIAISTTFVSHCTNHPYDVLTRPAVVYLLPCYDFSRSERVEPICDAPQQFCFIHSTCCLRLSRYLASGNVYSKPSRWIRRCATLDKTSCFIHNRRDYTTCCTSSICPG